MTGHYAHCLDCDWRAEGDTADREAEKHTKKEKHSTVAGMVNDDALPKTPVASDRDMGLLYPRWKPDE